jgi:ribosomal protein S18 acetylase RimI-like enzyme
MEPTHVRAGVAADANAIARVHVRSWEAAYRGVVPDAVIDRFSVEDRERTWRERLSVRGAPSFTLVAEHDRRLAGFCSVILPSRDDDAGERTGEVAAVYVDPDDWRAGVGRALLEASLSLLRQQAWDDATLWVLASNERARAFYERFGFVPDGARMQDERGAEVRLRATLTN